MTASDDPPGSAGVPSEEVLATVTKSLVEVGCVVDSEGRIVKTLSEPGSETAVIAEPSIEGEPVTAAFDSALDTRLLDTLLEVQRSGTRQTFDAVVDGSDGRERFEVCVAPLDGSLRSDYAMALVRDVTDARQEQEWLQRQQRAVRDVLDASDDLLLVFDETARLTQWNEAFERLVGETDLSGAALPSLTPADDARRLESFVDELSRSGSARVEADLAPHDGFSASYEFVGTAFECPSGAGGFVAVGRNVTQSRQYEREIDWQRRRLDLVIDAIDDVVYIFDADGTLQQWNQSLARVTGYTNEQLREMDPTDFFPESDEEPILRAFADAFQSGSAVVEAPIVTRSGQKIPFQFAANTIDGPDGETVLCGIGRDITDLIEREEQIAVLSRALRHNVRNKMTVVSGEAQYLQDCLLESLSDSDTQAVAADFKRNLDRIDRAASDLLDLSENSYDITRILLDHQSPEPVDVVPDLERVVTRMRAAYPEADITTELDADLTVIAIPQLSRTVLELVENACEHNEAPTVTVAAECRDGSVLLSVSDDGTGLPPNEANVITRDRPMSPVFHDSGMGLWLTRWIVRLSDGTIDYQKSADGGARFEIELDLAR